MGLSGFVDFVKVITKKAIAVTNVIIIIIGGCGQLIGGFATGLKPVEKVGA